ncbi:Uncharacterised protein g5197 [Pycnogonum litorale]
MALSNIYKMLTVLLLTVFNLLSVNGNYCEYAACKSDQYCCGDDLCCDYVYSLWYFWVGLIFFIMVLSLCGGLCRHFYYGASRPIIIQRITSYVPVARPYTDEVDHLTRAEAVCDIPPEYPECKGEFHAPPQGPPPPYTSSNHESPSESNIDRSSHYHQQHGRYPR